MNKENYIVALNDAEKAELAKAVKLLSDYSVDSFVMGDTNNIRAILLYLGRVPAFRDLCRQLTYEWSGPMITKEEALKEMKNKRLSKMLKPAIGFQFDEMRQRYMFEVESNICWGVNAVPLKKYVVMLRNTVSMSNTNVQLGFVISDDWSYNPKFFFSGSSFTLPPFPKDPPHKFMKKYLEFMAKNKFEVDGFMETTRLEMMYANSIINDKNHRYMPRFMYSLMREWEHVVDVNFFGTPLQMTTIIGGDKQPTTLTIEVFNDAEGRMWWTPDLLMDGDINEMNVENRAVTMDVCLDRYMTVNGAHWEEVTMLVPPDNISWELPSYLYKPLDHFKSRMSSDE